jgi:hypothetical protein
MIRKWFIGCFLLLGLSACVKDKPNPAIRPELNTAHRKALVLNEGSYGLNNADISILDLDSGISLNQMYKLANNKSLGDVAQHMTKIDGNYWIAINNSNRIVIIDTANLKEVATIQHVKYPRYILQVSPTKAYVSSMYFSYIQIIDIPSKTIVGQIPTDFPNQEQMIIHEGMVYCTNWDTASNLLYKIDPNTDAVVKKKNLPGRASHSIVKDKSNQLWILSGNKYKNKTSTLSCLNPSQDTIIHSFTFPADADPIKLSINLSGDTMYFIHVDYLGQSNNNGLFRMAITDNQLPSTPFIQAQPNSYIWGISIDPQTGHVFITDPKGFTQQSTVMEYTSEGKLLRSFPCGIGANSILFP